MARLTPIFLERMEGFCCRAIDLAVAVCSKSPSHRIVDQLVVSGTSEGANLYEADEAMSRADFAKCACIAVKELNENRFWIRLIERKQWVDPKRLAPLEAECQELKKILGAMISKTKANPTSSRN